MRCALCGNFLSKTYLCKKCGRAFCDKEQISECKFCKLGLFAGQISKEKFSNTTVEWLSIENGQRLGLIGFDRVPKVAVRILDALMKTFEKNSFKTILFPSKKASNDFIRSIAKQLGYKPGHEMLPLQRQERSRYSLFIIKKTNERLLLLNERSVSQTSIDFMFEITSS